MALKATTILCNTIALVMEKRRENLEVNAWIDLFCTIHTSFCRKICTSERKSHLIENSPLQTVSFVANLNNTPRRSFFSFFGSKFVALSLHICNETGKSRRKTCFLPVKEMHHFIKPVVVIAATVVLFSIYFSTKTILRK